MAVPPEEVVQSDFDIPAFTVGTQVHLLLFKGSPKSFNKDVVVATFSPGSDGLDLFHL
jgi:hypothetical protein